jgi:hypothetical protein
METPENNHEASEPNNHQSAGHGHHRFHIHIDDDRFELEHPIITGREIMKLVNKRPCRYSLVQVFPHADDQFVEPDEKVDLAKPDTERFVTVQKERVAITVKGEAFEVKAGEHSVAQILKLVGETVDGYDLLEEKEGPPMPIPPSQPVHIHGCEIFHTQVKSGGSS